MPLEDDPADVRRGVRAPPIEPGPRHSGPTTRRFVTSNRSEGVRTQRHIVLTGHQRLVFIALSIASAAAIAFFVMAVFRTADWRFQPVATISLLVLGAIVLINQQGRWYLLMLMRRPAHVDPPTGLRVATVTTYVPGLESLEMTEQTLRAMLALDYPHDTWLLDEGGTDEARALCERLGVRWFTRNADDRYLEDSGPFRRGTKAGNYNAWLYEAGFDRYDVLVAFDPDHVPTPAYLDRVLGHFRDPTVGYVQAAQAFYNHDASFIARGAAEETYAYYSAVQMAAYGAGYPIIVGSHNVHRMIALRQVGGFADHDADDLLLTLRYRAAGWEGVYVPEIIARGLAPTDWHSYLVQQRRWARSVLDIKLRRWNAYSGSLPLGARIMSFLHGVNYLHRAIVIGATLLLLVALVLMDRTPTLLRNPPLAELVLMVLVLHLAELYRQRFYLDWRSERGTHWRAAVLEFGKWPWFLLALGDVILGRRTRYDVTPKAGRAVVPQSFIRFHAAVAAVLLAACAAAWLIRGSVAPLLGWAAAIAAMLSIGLAASGLRRYPAPFDPRLAPHPSAEGTPKPTR